jgi:hypothetical protein
MTDDERFAMAITALAESYRQKVTPGLFHGYRMGLSGLSTTDIERACATALQKCKFMPVPAELRELAGTGGDSYESMAERAFHTLDKAVTSLGADRSVNFHDGAINAAVRLLGGWQKCCDQPREEFEKWYRKDFIRTYIGVCRNGASEELRRYHGGRIEQHNDAWVGRKLRSGITYQPGMFGSGVEAVLPDYVPALPAPEPTRRLADGSHEVIKPELKLIGRDSR